MLRDADGLVAGGWVVASGEWVARFGFPAHAVPPEALPRARQQVDPASGCPPTMRGYLQAHRTAHLPCNEHVPMSSAPPQKGSGQATMRRRTAPHPQGYVLLRGRCHTLAHSLAAEPAVYPRLQTCDPPRELREAPSPAKLRTRVDSWLPLRLRRNQRCVFFSRQKFISAGYPFRCSRICKGRGSNMRGITNQNPCLRWVTSMTQLGIAGESLLLLTFQVGQEFWILLETAHTAGGYAKTNSVLLPVARPVRG